MPHDISAQRFRVTDTLAGAIGWAYDVEHYQLSGGPPWIDRDYFLIEGVTPAPVTATELRAMLRTLLAERFALRVHRASKEMPVYGLLVLPTGVKLQAAAERCGRDGDGCINVWTGAPPGVLIAADATMASTAAVLTHLTGRPVVDMTGLSGRYDFRIIYDPTFTTPTPEAPSLFTAIQDLGLKLVPQRWRVETVVIDSAAVPSPN